MAAAKDIQKMDISTLVMYGFVASLPLALITAIIFCIVSAVRVNKRNNAQPVRTLLAQVAWKRGGYYNPTNVVKFRTEDGELLELSVTDDSEYVRLHEGTSGMLTFRGWNFRSFVPSSSPDEVPEQPQP